MPNIELSPPLNHVYVDYENVSAIDETVIGNQGVTFTLLLGPQKKKLDVELVEQLFAHAASVELIRLTRSGRNALDFALAYYLGRAVAADPAGFFHIIAKDTGYDPLIDHLRSRGIKVQRHVDFSGLSFGRVAEARPTAAAKVAVAPAKLKPTPASDPLARAVEHLRTHPNNRPRRRKTLVTHLTNLLGPRGSEAAVSRVIDELMAAGYIAIDTKDAVTYPLAKGH